MKFERFFFPLIVVAAIVSVWYALRGGKSVTTIIQQNSPLPAFASLFGAGNANQSTPAGQGTATSQPLQPLPWYISYNVPPAVAPLPINSLSASGQGGCETCGNNIYV